MDTGRISARYANAVYQYAVGKGQEDVLYGEMKKLADSFFAFRALTRVIQDPTVSAKNKTDVLITAAGGNSVSDVFKSLLHLVIENKREAYVQFIALSYQKLYRKEKGIVIGKLTLAQSSEKGVQDKLRQVIEKSAVSKVDFVTKVDSSIIGGFILELEDNQLDASIKSQLSKMRLQLVEMNKEIG